MTEYSFALGQMPPDVEGRRPQALILMDSITGKRIACVPYAAAGDLLVAAMGVASYAKPVT